MMRWLMVLGLAWPATALAAEEFVAFERERVGTATYEAASVFDVDRDGRPDIVCGEFWFAGPDYRTARRIATIPRIDDYYDDFSDIPLDVNGDGWIDIVTGGWWGATLRWRENPRGGPGPWRTHDIDKCGNIETTRAWDVDGDGHLDIVPNAGGRVAVYTLDRDRDGKPLGTFTKHVVKEGGCGHGLGFGDVNGDGRGDFIVPDGWIEAPASPWTQEWTFHAEFSFGLASVPILVHDVDEDGLADLIVGQAHNYGLAWWQQRNEGDKRTWTCHVIDPDRSQYHELVLADVDRDSRPELVTGKRYRAHLGHDPGAADPIGLYYFKIDRGRFTRVTLDYGPATHASGAGIFLWVNDLDGNGWPDIVAPGKEGLYVFRNQGLVRVRD